MDREQSEQSRNRQESPLNIPDPVSAVKKIKYIVLKDDVAPHANASSDLKKLAGVQTLVVRNVFYDRAKDIRMEPVVGKALGDRIRFLILGRFRLDVNEFLSYLCLFPFLEYLEADVHLIKPGIFKDQTPIPEFRGTLRLDPRLVTRHATCAF